MILASLRGVRKANDAAISLEIIPVHLMLLCHPEFFVSTPLGGGMPLENGSRCGSIERI